MADLVPADYIDTIVADYINDIDSYIIDRNSKMLHHLCFGGDLVFMTLPLRIRCDFKTYIVDRLLETGALAMYQVFCEDQIDYVIDTVREMLERLAPEHEVYNLLQFEANMLNEESIVKILAACFANRRPKWWGESRRGTVLNTPHTFFMKEDWTRLSFDH